MADLFGILENKEPLVEWKPKRETHSKYNNNEPPNQIKTDLIQETVPHKSNKNLIYEQAILPEIKEIKKELIGYKNSELSFKITRSGMKNENRFAIEITKNTPLGASQRIRLENLLRLYYNQLPESRFGREFTRLGNTYTIKLERLFDILQNK